MRCEKDDGKDSNLYSDAKNIPVAQIRLPSVTAAVSAAGEIFTPAHVPKDVAYSGEDIEQQEVKSCCK